MKLKISVVFVFLTLVPVLPTDKIDKNNCAYKGFRLWGKIQFVKSFPDLKIKIVQSFPDLKVKMVSNFADSCGKWQNVENFPDLKVQIVNLFPDITIQYVDSFPGVN